MSSQHTVIVGGGIIGTLCGWYLTEAGHRVTIVDRGAFGAACSKSNCGYVSPSHVLPLTAPGVIWKSLKSMTSGDSPFYVKPTLNLQRLGWFFKFARRCNERDMLEAAGVLHELLQTSKQLYEDLIEGEGLECEWRKDGLLFVYKSVHEFEEYAKVNQMTSERFGVSAKPLDAAELVKFEPALREGLGGAWFFDCDAHLRPDRLLAALRAKLETRGATFLENTEVKELISEGSHVRGVRTTTGEIIGDRFVVATGAWTPFLNQQLGLKIPIQPGKGYSLTMPRPQNCPRLPMIFEEHRVAITPMDSGYRIGSTMEFVGYDDSINERRLNLLKRSAEIYLREPYTEPIEERWFGWRPMTWDSKPLIDRVPKFSNVWLAAGHNMLGLSLGAVTGKMITQLINQETPIVDPRGVGLARLSR
jgi:D-amino-acid dehydrogenase